MLRLVHVSDIHFRHGPGWDLDADQRDQLTVDLATLVEEEGHPVDGILVGGDVAFSGSKTQYDDAHAWLERMIDVSGCPTGGVWLVPGNHDVARSVIDTSKILKDFRKETREEPLDTLDALLNERMAIDAAGSGLLEPFREYNSFANHWGCETSAAKLEWTDSLGGMDGTPVKLWGINSAFISDEKDARDEDLPNLVLGSQQCKVEEELGQIRIVLCHHPPERLRDWEQVSAYLKRAHLLLFGHEHQFRWEQPDPRGQAWIHAGAVIPEKGGGRLAAYNLLRLTLDADDLVLEIRSRVWSEEDKRFVAAVSDPEPIKIARDLRRLGEIEMRTDEQKEPAEPITATPLTPQEQGQAPLTIDEQARLRQIAVAYMSAPATTRLEIAKRLKALEDADLAIPTDRERYGTILRRIRDREQIDQLAEELDL